MIKNQNKKKLNCIGFFPAGNENTGSTRIRIFSMFPYLEKMGFCYICKPSLRNLYKTDILVIQKRLTSRIIKISRIAKVLGKLIIYDVDDLGPTLWKSAPKKLLDKMVILADVIMVGSEPQKEYLQIRYPGKEIVLLPPAIDYYPSEPIRNKYDSEECLRIVWFGVSAHISIFEKYINNLSKMHSIKIIVITNENAIGKLRNKYPFIHFEPWNVINFTDVLRSCHLSLLMHDGTKYDRTKTNNKMITSITWGVPAIVSDTYDYKNTARKAGVNYAVFSNSEQMAEIIEKLRTPEARNKYLEIAQPIIWRDYSPEVITVKFSNLCKIHKSKHLFTRLVSISRSFQ
jgi:hypothetical protein